MLQDFKIFSPRFAMRVNFACVLVLVLPGHLHSKTIGRQLAIEKVPVTSNSPLRALWATEIQEAIRRQNEVRARVSSAKDYTEATFLTATISTGSRTYVISTMDQRGAPSCKQERKFPKGMEDKSVECPLKIAVKEPSGQLKPVFSGVTCSARDFDAVTAVMTTNSRVYTAIDFDTTTKTIVIKGVQEGSDICQNHPIKLP